VRETLAVELRTTSLSRAAILCWNPAISRRSARPMTIKPRGHSFRSLSAGGRPAKVHAKLEFSSTAEAQHRPWTRHCHVSIKLTRQLILTTARLLRQTTTGRGQDQVCDFLRVGDQGEMTCVQLHCRCLHALCQEALQVRCDRFI
jgi:hypothetical protein